MAVESLVMSRSTIEAVQICTSALHEFGHLFLSALQRNVVRWLGKCDEHSDDLDILQTEFEFADLLSNLDNMVYLERNITATLVGTFTQRFPRSTLNNRRAHMGTKRSDDPSVLRPDLAQIAARLKGVSRTEIADIVDIMPPFTDGDVFTNEIPGIQATVAQLNRNLRRPLYWRHT